MLPKHNRPSNSMGGKHLLQHEALTHPSSVPSTISWVGTGGGGVVTDQAVCGSCWAFATAAALQGALWMKTGMSHLSSVWKAQIHKNRLRRCVKWCLEITVLRAAEFCNCWTNGPAAGSCSGSNARLAVRRKA